MRVRELRTYWKKYGEAPPGGRQSQQSSAQPYTRLVRIFQSFCDNPLEVVRSHELEELPSPTPNRERLRDTSAYACFRVLGLSL
jgi:hypothetical protein